MWLDNLQINAMREKFSTVEVTLLFKEINATLKHFGITSLQYNEKCLTYV
jgi:hypothetical protein